MRGVSRMQFLKQCLGAMAGLSLLGLAGCGCSQDGGEGGHDDGHGKKDDDGGGGGGGY
jgi:hypothetical protein